MDRPRVVVITGPTAAGKTALGVELGLRARGEVISADSMQIYRGMDIGTAKPDPEEMKGVPHHLLSIADPSENWSVARWAEEAVRAAEEIFSRGRIPLVVGGTGLYIEALLSGTDFAAAPGDSGLRRELEREYEELGGEGFRRKLAGTDPERAARLAPADRKRLVRAMEVYILTGETITEHDRRTAALPPRFDSVRYALSFRDRETLYARIRLRVDDMVRRGLFDETRALLEAGVSPDATAMQAIGYKEAAAALRGECTREEAAEMIKRASTRYAKRQLTWLRRDKELRWIFREDRPDPERTAEEILGELERE